MKNTPNAIATPARDALRKQRAELHELTTQQAALHQRIESFQDAASRAQPSQQRLDSLKARRPALLADVALREASHDELEKLDRELQDAEAQARAAARGQEIAAAGAARLQQQLADLAVKAAPVAQGMAALLHAAAVEMAVERLADYRAAVEAMGRAHAVLAGTCAAADTFADMFIDPRRLPVQGELHRMQFAALLPNLPGIKQEQWQFDFSSLGAAAQAEALAELDAIGAKG
jgi:DNA repair exonuclease SbcCD ATPase subunit